MTLTSNALTVLKKRGYLLSQSKSWERPEAMFHRVAHVVASPDLFYGVSDQEVHRTEERFFRMMASLEFLAGAVLLNAGRRNRMLAACFVLPINDSLESIFETMKNAALVSRMGGGLGISFSKLRSRGSGISSTGGVSSGPVSYIELFNHMGQVINEGCSRRVAMLAALGVNHPDIIEFITSKDRSGALANFNISVVITDQFMKACKKDAQYNLIDPHSQLTVRTVKARQIWDLIAKMAWKTADPGLLFIDRINRDNPVAHLGQIESTNVCGEQPLLPFESCNLGNINLAKVVKKTGTGPEVDWPKLGGLVKDGTHFLDNVIDICEYPLPEIAKMARMTRKIGLGVMGWADLLLELGIPYHSLKALQLAEKIAQFIQDSARAASADLGRIRGSFPAFAGSRWEKTHQAMRNSTVNTVAPTGTISILANCSSGIEPVFAFSYIRRNLLDLAKTEMLEINPIFENVARKSGFYSQELMHRVSRLGSLQEIKEIPGEVKKVFVTAHDISWEWHVRMQAAWQKYTDSGVSKTINLPHRAGPDEVAQAFELAFATGCKGITVYRDRSKEKQVLNIGTPQPADNSLTEATKIDVCPECRYQMEFRDDCAVCPNCAYSYCLS